MKLIACTFFENDDVLYSIQGLQFFEVIVDRLHIYVFQFITIRIKGLFFIWFIGKIQGPAKDFLPCRKYTRLYSHSIVLNLDKQKGQRNKETKKNASSLL